MIQLTFRNQWNYLCQFLTYLKDWGFQLPNLNANFHSSCRCMKERIAFNIQACLYSLEHKVPLIAFCEGRCLTLFHDPLVDSLHTIYHEPKVPCFWNSICFLAFYFSIYCVLARNILQAEVMPSVEHLLASADIQVFL